jgi:hypothetical protein
MNAHHAASDLASLRRAVLGAPPENTEAVYRQTVREGYRLHTVGHVPKADVIDALRDIGYEAALGENIIQSALENAVDRPFDPGAVKARAMTYAGPRPPSRNPAVLVSRRAADIEPEPIRWLWPQRIAIGKLTMLAGEPGLGKSQTTCWMAATVTTAGHWPGNEGTADLGSVIILSAEDDAADTVRPRLDAAGADVSKVYIVSAVKVDDGSRRSFNIQADLLLLEREIERIGDVRLVIIDPVSSYLGRVDSHKNAELRAVLEPIGEMAGRMGVAMVAVTHLSKGGGGGANSRIIGSIAFVAAARAAFIVCRDPDDQERRLFLPTKNNLGKEGEGIGFRVGTQLTPSGIVAPTIFWDAEPVTMSADQALAAQGMDDDDAPARSEAEDFLRNLLADGPRATRELQSEAKAAGLSWATIRRAKDQLGAVAAKTGIDGGWTWTLPEDAHEKIEDARLP